MYGDSKKIITTLADINKKQNVQVTEAVKKKFIAPLVLAPLASENTVKSNVAVVAPVSGGKSTLFNGLCGYPILPVARTITSCAPTYITRAESKDSECITVYALKKEVAERDGVTSTSFVRDEKTKREFTADKISRTMFDALKGYMHTVMNPDINITVENLLYFMDGPENSYILLNGTDTEKRSLTEESFALSYDDNRHRLLLLMILLCLYVKQDKNSEKINPHIKALNDKRKKLIKEYNLPADGDYCVCLDWYSENIPEGVTLIDLPGTGSSTEGNEEQSSHTTIVKKILENVDAIWVLCSDTGVVEQDLLTALDDVIGGDSKKNKVCIYNCKDGLVNESSNVKNFLELIPALAGERCYVVNARAGEYQYLDGGINALHTHMGIAMRMQANLMPILRSALTEENVKESLRVSYEGEETSACTFTTHRDSGGNIIVEQDPSVKYTLASFFKSALIDYTERLKYQVALRAIVKESDKHINVRAQLCATLAFLEAVNGKGPEVMDVVEEALKEAQNRAEDNFIVKATEVQRDILNIVDNLSDKLSDKIKDKFLDEFFDLMGTIKAAWNRLQDGKSLRCLEKGILGNYPMWDGREIGERNIAKFEATQKEVAALIKIDAFCGAMKVVDNELEAYRKALKDYVTKLKGVLFDFRNDYLYEFGKAYDEKCIEILRERKDGTLKDLEENFSVARRKIYSAIEAKFGAMSAPICAGFEELTNEDGIFDKLCREIKADYTSKFTENILGTIRIYALRKLRDEISTGFFEQITVDGLSNLITKTDNTIKNECTARLKELIAQKYGKQPETESGGGKNFPQELAERVKNFNSEQITNGAEKAIKDTHANIMGFVECSVSSAVDVKKEIEELDEILKEWDVIGTIFESLEIEDGDTPLTKALYTEAKGKLVEVKEGPTAKE